ncbi:MAG: sigma-70 family RNA polymerase sigma factor [Verrucomicrobia bacterium]|nr:sigma-70 family RNA polymerase sigma factor [Verrucomicrobiota bacterium]
MRDPVDADSDTLLPTRQSLLTRLRDWQDEAGWREFFDTYWRLIYKVACQAGLSDIQAQEVVQNTFVYLARKMPKFHYDRTRGSYKSWLRVVTRSRIQVYFRSEQRQRQFIRDPSPSDEDDASNFIESFPDPASDQLDEIWQREWEDNLITVAFQRLRSKVSSQQLLIFRLGTLSDTPASQVAKKLRVSVPQIYLARHRVGKLFQAELKRLRAELE